MTRCSCNRASQGVALPRVGDHMNPYCRHSTLYFTCTVMPALRRLWVKRLRRGRRFVDDYNATRGVVLRFPDERATPIPIEKRGVYVQRTRVEEVA